MRCLYFLNYVLKWLNTDPRGSGLLVSSLWKMNSSLLYKLTLECWLWLITYTFQALEKLNENRAKLFQKIDYVLYKRFSQGKWSMFFVATLKWRFDLLCSFNKLFLTQETSREGTFASYAVMLKNFYEKIYKLLKVATRNQNRINNFQLCARMWKGFDKSHLFYSSGSVFNKIAKHNCWKSTYYKLHVSWKGSIAKHL